MRLKLTVPLIILLCVSLTLSVAKADVVTTTQAFRIQDIDKWNIQDLYHDNTIISFTIASGVLNATGTVNYDNTNGTLTLTPKTDCVLMVSANSTSFTAFFNGADLAAGAVSLPANQLSTVTWQWTPSTITEENMFAYVVVGVVVIGVVVFMLAFLLFRKRED